MKGFLIDVVLLCVCFFAARCVRLLDGRDDCSNCLYIYRSENQNNHSTQSLYIQSLYIQSLYIQSRYIPHHWNKKWCLTRTRRMNKKADQSMSTNKIGRASW